MANTREPRSTSDVRTAAQAVENADVALGQQLASHRDEPLVQAAGKAGKIGDQEPLYALSALLLGIGFGLNNRRLAGAAIAMFAATGAADAGKTLAKRLVSRTRPHVLLDEGRYATEAGGSDNKPEQSFPSGHMAGSVAAARAISRTYPKAGVGAGIAAVAIGLSRLVKGAHWPLDLLAGSVIGLAGEAITSHLLGQLGVTVFVDRQERE